MKKLKKLMVTLGLITTLVTGMTFVSPIQEASAADHRSLRVHADYEYSQGRIWLAPGERVEFVARNYGMYGVHVKVWQGNRTFYKYPIKKFDTGRYNAAVGWVNYSLECVDTDHCDGGMWIKTGKF
ncbi:hypothetical protein [Bacillus sp. TL12]|uniref:hypothetical protein n=1 Tax=Bacillus sp. TL12 TaxID=2894756 RepID=UPI001F51DF61|nr:hypothetical protein [Bacillus sp. TL12]MCI0768496.1 hypothetical protein [Bacillus sp. TL12]